MVSIVVSTFELEMVLKDCKWEYVRTNYSCRKSFEWPTVPRVGESLQFKSGSAEVKSVTHMMNKEIPVVFLNCESQFGIQGLVISGWEAFGSLKGARIPHESEYYNFKNPIPLDADVELLPMPVRICNFLKKGNITTVGQLCIMSEIEIQKVYGIKRRSVKIILEALSRVGRPQV